jgi:transposase
MVTVIDEGVSRRCEEPTPTTRALFSTVRLEDFVPASHPLRPIRIWVNDALARWTRSFRPCTKPTSSGGRPSIAPEKLMRAMLLQVLFSVRSERQLVEQINYNLLFRWFVGLSIDDAVWNHSVFSKNRDRLIEHDAVTELFNATVAMAEQRGLLSGEHFSVDGTLIQAWASHKSMRRKDGSDDGRPARRLARRAAQQRDARVHAATPSRGCTARATRRRRCRATWAMCSATTATDWWSTCVPARPTAWPSARRPRRCWPTWPASRASA